MNGTGHRQLILLVFIALGAASCSDADRDELASSCEAKDMIACRELGQMRIDGVDGPMDKKGGRLAFESACKLGDAASCKVAGDLLYARRDGNSRYWLERGCEAEDARSCTDLGWMVWHGEGGVADPARAGELFERACREGDARGCQFAAFYWEEQLTDGDLPADEQRDLRIKATRLEMRACSLGERFACQRRGE